MKRLIKCLCFAWLIFVTTANANSANTPLTDNTEVKAFITRMVTQYHFKKSELITLFKAVKLRHTVVKHIKNPNERKTWTTYRSLFVTEQRIWHGVKFWNQYQDVLARAEKKYGVPASIIVATIGVETNYGQNIGEFPVIDALATLAFSQTSRAPFFLNELEQFLLLAREQHLNPLKVMGSYAGAIGQPQFMPSSYRKYAVNFSGNKKIDLSHNEEDIIGSIANYYKQNGWDNCDLITVPASIASGKYQLSYTRPRPISASELIQAGILPNNQLSTYPKYKLLKLQGDYQSEYWLVFNNFDVIKRYNFSDLYAMAVYQLSYYIATRKGHTNSTLK